MPLSEGWGRLGERDLAMPNDALPDWMIELAEQVG
jgi:hypothetical protein